MMKLENKYTTALYAAIDASKIKNELNWEPQTSFETGIDKTVRWYLKHFKALS